jgi:hypothetical protein
MTSEYIIATAALDNIVIFVIPFENNDLSPQFLYRWLSTNQHIQVNARVVALIFSFGISVFSKEYAFPILLAYVPLKMCGS